MLAFEHNIGEYCMHLSLRNNGIIKPVKVYTYTLGKEWKKVTSVLLTFIKKIVLTLLDSLITCECLHFWHPVATGRGKPGKMTSSCWKINSCTFSMVCSKYATPNGTVVWITREGPIFDDTSIRETKRYTLKWVAQEGLSASQSRFKNQTQEPDNKWKENRF